MDKRSLFHWSREFSRSLKKGQDYSRLPDVIAINIVNFDYLATNDFHNCFHLRDDKERDIILTSALEIHFLNMVRFRKLKNKDILSDPLYRWLAWFDKNSPPDLIKEVVKMDTAIQTADERLLFVIGDEDAIRDYDMRFTAACDETSNRNYYLRKGRKEGYNNGLRKGREEGHIESRLEIAKNALSKGIPIETVHDITGLDLVTLKNMRVDIGG